MGYAHLMKKLASPARYFVAVVFAYFSSERAGLAAVAYDDASDPAYSGGWTNGSNGGYGFGPWVLAHPTPATAFGIGPSTENDDGLDDGTIGGLVGDGDIGTAFRLRGDAGIATAGRRFLSGPLGIGETFSIDFDNGWQNETTYSIRLYETDAFFAPANLSFSVTLQLGSAYEYTDIGSGFGWLPHGTEGVRFEFTLTGEIDYGTYTNYAYSATLTRRDGSSATLTGEVGSRPNYIEALHKIPHGGDPVREGFYINNLSIVPEPSSALLALIGLGLLGLCGRHRLNGSS